jgi:hypothetical protein
MGFHRVGFKTFAPQVLFQLRQQWLRLRRGWPLSLNPPQDKMDGHQLAAAPACQIRWLAQMRLPITPQLLAQI